jgi:hypothetical protein
MSNPVDKDFYADVLIGGVDAASRVANAGGHEWQLQGMDERIVGAAAAGHGRDNHISAVNLGGRFIG